MTKVKPTDLHGGEQDGLGISPSVTESSAEKNEKDPVTSAAGKILQKPKSNK